jgi:ubiquinone/menaquinone biosynthesis C-methylase UbiE
MKAQDVIEQARQGFDEELHTAEYRKIHADAVQLEALLQMVDIRANKRYLDLGTGDGYIAFELAARFPSLFVTGLDIAVNSIRVNQGIQRERGLSNLGFQAYDGVRLPFDDTTFYGVIARYAFHHFPAAQVAVKELHRVVESNGFVIISDPITHAEDDGDFIDQFQQLKPDGHIHFYRPHELGTLLGQRGFRQETHYMSSMTYPREVNPEYRQLLNRTPASVLESYCVNLGETHVQLTVAVMNVLFREGA